MRGWGHFSICVRSRAFAGSQARLPACLPALCAALGFDDLLGGMGAPAPQQQSSARQQLGAGVPLAGLGAGGVGGVPMAAGQANHKLPPAPAKKDPFADLF